MRVTKEIGPPTGLRRLMFRLPIHMYHMRLGWMLGDHLMLLHHVGRISGKPREVVLEIAEHDQETDSFVVASGWGPTAAWYRNVLQTPDVTIEVGRRSLAVSALPLTREEGAEIFVRYASRRATLAKYVLPLLMGYAVDGSEADFREAGMRMPFVRFVPRS